MTATASPETARPALTPFTPMLATLQAMDGGFQITLADDWLQGRTAYGGLSAAVCLEASLQAFANLPPLRSAQFAFVGPATGVLRVTPQLLRQGKSAAFVAVDLAGDSGLAVRATFCFGAGRDSPSEYSRDRMPATPPPEACPDFFAWTPKPRFMAHFEGRLAGGAAALSAAADPAMTVWLRHRDAAAAGSSVGLLALADALPPVIFAGLREAVPISTMTWAVDLLDAQPQSDTGWWLVRGEAETLHEGYSAQRCVIWHPSGRPVLAARQTVAVFGGR